MLPQVNKGFPTKNYGQSLATLKSVHSRNKSLNNKLAVRQGYLSVRASNNQLSQAYDKFHEAMSTAEAAKVETTTISDRTSQAKTRLQKGSSLNNNREHERFITNDNSL